MTWLRGTNMSNDQLIEILDAYVSRMSLVDLRTLLDSAEERNTKDSITEIIHYMPDVDLIRISADIKRICK